jgi:hypothetical protein
MIKINYGHKSQKNVNATLFTTTVGERQCRDRVTHLMKKFRADEMASLRASGTEEDYDEREQLLTELKDILDELKHEKENKKDSERKKEKEQESQGKELRVNAMQGLLKRKENNSSDEDEEKLTPPSKKKRSINQKQEILQYLREKNEKERVMRERELEVERMRIEAEKIRIEAESRDREQQRLQINQLIEILARK